MSFAATFGVGRKSMRAAFAEARAIDRLAAELEDLDSPSPTPPESSLLRLARRRTRRK